MKNRIEYKQELVDVLMSYITKEKRNRIEAVLPNRTRYVTVVAEDFMHAHNLSAMIRSCESFGIQDVYVIENKYKYRVNVGITKGASEWINFIRYNAQEDNTWQAYADLKKNGYRIIATAPQSSGFTLSELPIDKKMALVFGTEGTGLSTFAAKEADAFVEIPTYGFTQSLNVSVSAAICLYDIIMRLQKSDIHWRLSCEDSLDVQLSWLRHIVSGSHEIERRFFESKK